MTPEEEIASIRASIARLQKKRKELEAEREAKVRLFKAKVGLVGAKLNQIPAKAAADHPLVFGAGELIGNAAKSAYNEIAPEVKPAWKALGRYIKKKKLQQEEEERKKRVSV